MFITYRDELSKTERLFPLEKIGLAEYQYETGKLVIWLGGDETFAIDGDEAKRVWTELKSKMNIRQGPLQAIPAPGRGTGE